MKAEQAKKLTDQALDELAQTLEQGKSESLTAYLAVMGRFHRYSFGNVLLIMMQKSDATRVAGYRTWQKLGRQVKRGEKGIVIIAPMFIRPKDNAANHRPNDGDSTILHFKTARVFDLSQTDGKPLPEFAKIGGNPNGQTERLKALVSRRGIKLEYTADIGSADGVSTGGIIKLRPDLAPAEEFTILVHELAHEELHKRNGEACPSKTVRETEAEAVAFVVSQAIGLETNTAAADYIQLYAGNKATLASSLDRIQKTAAEILEGLMRDGE